MINEVKVVSKQLMTEYIVNQKIPYLSWSYISIYNSSDPDPITEKLAKSIRCREFLSLKFDDVTKGEMDKIYIDSVKKPILFDRDMAKIVINFLDELKKYDKEEVLVVQCFAGISRSGAIGTFANDYYRLNYDLFCRKNHNIYANSHVLALLRRVGGMSYEESHDGRNYYDPDIM